MEPNFPNRGFDPHDWNRQYWRHRHGTHRAGLLPAAILIAVGAIFFLNNLHILTFREVLDYWPVVLIALGMVKAVDATDNAGRTGGAILIIVGAIFLAPTLGFWHIPVGDLWPLILIGVGGVLLFQRLGMPAINWGGGRIGAVPGAAPGMLSESAIFSGGRRRIVTPDFRGGEVSCIFGGFDIDLRKAGMAGDSAILVVNAIFGGCDIRVPENWDVVLEMTAVFGGCDDRTVHPDAGVPAAKRLFLRGSAIFGGIDVKN
ncbi:MAG TPA: DUF5668 domain-containing protein [Bryobacteraceae bacterium]|nr:DUF5668 domain-containing protein [Bryobacteraceae bacterium]